MLSGRRRHSFEQGGRERVNVSSPRRYARNIGSSRGVPRELSASSQRRVERVVKENRTRPKEEEEATAPVQLLRVELDTSHAASFPVGQAQGSSQRQERITTTNVDT